MQESCPPAIIKGSKFSNPEALVENVKWHRERGLARVLDIRLMFGFGAILVPVAEGKKRPLAKGYPDFTIEMMNDCGYLRQVEASNIAILTGPNSGGLVSVDLDTDEAAAEFASLNAELCAETVHSRGFRGRNFWFRLAGEYPEGPQKFHGADGKGIGEFRAGRCITVVAGRHPEGVEYLYEGEKVVECGFDDIRWPEDWRLPWGEDAFDEIIAAEGDILVVGERGGVTINQPAVVRKFELEHLVVHDPGLGFFIYHRESGIWEQKTEAAIAAMFSNDLKALADATDQPAILAKRSAGFLRSLTSQLAGKAERRNVFAGRDEPVIHALDGMLHISKDGVEVRNFDPGYRSLGRIPIAFDPDAKCDRFLDDLLRHALPENDILLLQKYAGQVLLGRNLSQTLLILEGLGGAGKGQIGTVIDLVVGRRNVAELRTAHLSGRFEMKSFVGKKLLAGRDVPGDFLSLKGAGALKKLTGGDLITVESKGKDERSEIKGKFNIIITSNTRLSLTIEGDRSAWERRLLVIPFEREPVAKPIPNFGEQLVEEEGEGILAWMVEGAQKLLSDLGECGRIRLDAVQRKRVSDLLAESDSVTTFVAGRVVRETGARAATSRLFEAYTGFCFNRDMPTVSRKQFERHVGAEMRRIHHASPSENILTGEDRSRGYLGVRLLRDSEEDIDVAE